MRMNLDHLDMPESKDKTNKIKTKKIKHRGNMVKEQKGQLERTPMSTVGQLVPQNYDSIELTKE